jgi:hypothetical protein
MNNETRGALRLLLATGLLSALCHGAVAAEQCRGPNGQFIKCPTMTPMHCRDITTKKFTKCDAPNSERIPESKPQPKAAPSTSK